MASVSEPHSTDLLTTYRHVWQNKPILRQIYEGDYNEIVSQLVPGPTLEIGGGSGNLKNYHPDIVTIDIQQVPWLDVVADAHHLPFSVGSFDNLVMFDVLHHLESPWLFLKEATRVLRPGGRLIAMEPAITPVSKIFYTFFHPEPVHMDVDPLAARELSPNRNPWDSNQAIPTLLFRVAPRELEDALPQLKLTHVNYHALFAYPLSGGFRKWSLVPQGVIAPLLRFEKTLMPLLGPLMAFRLLAVMQRV